MNHIRFFGAMRPQRDRRPSGRHPVDWVLVACFAGIVVVALGGWLR